MESDYDFNYVFCDKIIKFDKDAFWMTGNSYESISGTFTYAPYIQNGSLLLGYLVSGTTINAWKNQPIDITGYDIDYVWEAMINCYLPSGSLTLYLASGTSSVEASSAQLVEVENNDDLREIGINGNLWIKFGIEFNH